MRKKIIHWYWRAIAYQFWFLELNQHFRYLDLNHIFIHLQVAPSVANLLKRKCLWIWHDSSKPVFAWFQSLWLSIILVLTPFLQSSVDKIGKVKEIQSFNHLCYLYCIICFNVEEKSILKWVGSLNQIQRYLCKKGRFREQF